jgi:hypothetical protein
LALLLLVTFVQPKMYSVQSAVMADVEMQHEKWTENQDQPPQSTDDERDELGVGIADLTGDSVPWLFVHGYGSFESVCMVVIFPLLGPRSTCGMRTKG